jgi:hypothetical protein
MSPEWLLLGMGVLLTVVLAVFFLVVFGRKEDR